MEAWIWKNEPARMGSLEHLWTVVPHDTTPTSALMRTPTEEDEMQRRIVVILVYESEQDLNVG